MTIKVGIGGIGAVRDAQEDLVTYALGSCVAVILHDWKTGVWGMAHVALPKPARDTNGTRSEPGYYGTAAVDALLALMVPMGAEIRNMRVALIGGASVMPALDRFDIGKRNVLSLRKALWRHGMAPNSEEVGGNTSRTVRVHEDRVEISAPQLGVWTLQEAL